jgi:hypothetical protein
VRALTRQGTRSVSIEAVPDPVIPEATDAVVKEGDLYGRLRIGPALAMRSRATVMSAHVEWLSHWTSRLGRTKRVARPMLGGFSVGSVGRSEIEFG